MLSPKWRHPHGAGLRGLWLVGSRQQEGIQSPKHSHHPLQLSLVGLRGDLWLRRLEEGVCQRAAVPVNYACVGAVF